MSWGGQAELCFFAARILWHAAECGHFLIPRWALIFRVANGRAQLGCQFLVHEQVLCLGAYSAAAMLVRTYVSAEAAVSITLAVNVDADQIFCHNLGEACRGLCRDSPGIATG